MSDNYFCLFANCILVKGKSSSLIYDIGRGRLIDINNLLYDVLLQSKKMSIANLKQFYEGKFDAGIDAYVNLFIEEAIGFLCKKPDSFPELDFSWSSPFFIENCIIEYGRNYDLSKVLTELDLLSTRNIQLRIFQESDL